MSLYVKGYTICVTGTVLVAMIAILMSVKLHIRSVVGSLTKRDVLTGMDYVSIDAGYKMKTYDFKTDMLKSEVENRRVFLFKKYLENPVVGIPTKRISSKYSTINRVSTGKGFDLVFLRNVCFDAESSRVLLFTDVQDNSVFGSLFEGLPRKDLFAVVEREYPELNDGSTISSVGSYLFLSDLAMDLVSQFATVNFLVHFALHATQYPSLLHAFMPFLPSGSSALNEYLAILQSFYPSERAFDVYYKDDVPEGLFCFRELTVPSLLHHADEGMIHLDVYEADTTRLAAYRHYRLYERFPVPTTAVVLHAQSGKEVSGERGSIENMEELGQFFHKKIAIWTYRSMVLDGVSKATKLHALFETDILFGVAQTLLVNMIYLVPGSCVVAVSPCLLTSSHLTSIAEPSQLFFIEISNFSVPLPPACNDRSSDVVSHVYSTKCRHELEKQPIYVQPGMLMSYLRVAKTHTMIHKYYDVSEGDYE